MTLQNVKNPHLFAFWEMLFSEDNLERSKKWKVLFYLHEKLKIKDPRVPKITRKLTEKHEKTFQGGIKNLAFFWLGNLQDFGTIWGSKIGQKVVQKS